VTGYRVLLKPRAHKEFLDLPPDIARKVRDGIQSLGAEPRSHFVPGDKCEPNCSKLLPSVGYPRDLGESRHGKVGVQFLVVHELGKHCFTGISQRTEFKVSQYTPQRSDRFFPLTKLFAL